MRLEEEGPFYITFLQDFWLLRGMLAPLHHNSSDVQVGKVRLSNLIVVSTDLIRL